MKLYGENGLLNLYGKTAMDALLSEGIEMVLDTAKTEQELLTLKGVLAKYLGDKVSDRLAKVKKDATISSEVP